MLNIHTELPCGSISRGYDHQDESRALTTFARVVAQVKSWKKVVIDVVLMEDGVELQREHIDVA